MLNEMVEARIISFEEARLYSLFAVNEDGKGWLSQTRNDLFMEQPPPESIHKDVILMIDGRRSLIREIIYALEQISTKIREYQNDRPK